jgi:hypothetical protein
MSDNDSCSICLADLRDMCELSECMHKFCFACIKHWSSYSATCPLCKAPLKMGYHEFQPEQDVYRKYFFQPPIDRRSESRIITHPRRQRRRNQAPSPVRQLESEQAVALEQRRQIYALGLRARHVGSNRYSGFTSVPQPNLSEPQLERLRSFIRRELLIVLPSEADIGFFMNFLTGLLQRHRIQSETFVQSVRTFLGDHTDSFVHELACFARSTLSLRDYDSIYATIYPR